MIARFCFSKMILKFMQSHVSTQSKGRRAFVVYEVRASTSPLSGSFVKVRRSNSFQMNL